jgi:hypothetical protein
MEVAALRVRTYDGLLRELDRRRRELGMTMADVDSKSGVQEGYSSKLFVGIRRFGEMSLPAVLGALSADLVIVPRQSAAPVERRVGSCGNIGAPRPSNEGAPS